MSGRRLKPALRMSLNFFVLLTTGCPLFSCPEELLFPGVGLVTGRVVDVNGNGIAGITVSAGLSDNTGSTTEREAVTDASGAYRIENVDAGPQRLVQIIQNDVFNADYFAGTLSHSVEVADARTTRVPDLVVRRFARVRGVVRLAGSGAPISGASVRCSLICEPGFVVTGADGSYSFKTREGVVNIEASAPNLVLASGRGSEEVALADGESRALDLVLTGLGSVRARVISVLGQINGAHWVTLTGRLATPADDEVSDRVREKLFLDVVAGTHQISLEPWPGWEVIPGETVQRTVQVQSGATAVVEWRVRPVGISGVLRGRVTTEAGTPVAQVRITHSSGLERHTDAVGEYVFGVEVGSQTLTLTVPGGYELVPEVPVQTAVRTVTVALGETITVNWRIRPVSTATTGTVVAHVRVGGVPLSGVTIRLGATELVTNGSGDVTFTNVPVGQHNVQITVPDGLGSDDPSTKTVTVTGGGTAEVTWNLSEEDDGYTPPGGGGGYQPPNGLMAPPRTTPPPTAGPDARPAIPMRALPTPAPTRPRVPEL